MKKTAMLLIIVSLIVIAGCGEKGISVYGDNATISTTTEQTNAQAVVDVNAETSVNAESSVSNVTSNDQQVLTKENDTAYEQLHSDYEKLRTENDNLKEQIEDLKQQTKDMPTVSLSDLSLSIDGEDIPVNKNNAMATIEGRDYISKEIVEKIISEGQEATIQDNILYIGRIVSEKANLFDKHLNSSSECWIYDTETDSYGNIRSNVLYFSGSQAHNAIFALDKKYMFLKFTIAMCDRAQSGKTGTIIVKADGETVYTSDSLNKQTAPFEVKDIVINECTLLTIEYTSDYNNHCLIADAVLYN